uniref:Glycosyltransferase family 92 protein n=1 Tax=Angiostrongylus cantonensis TaxID=6313 RepID=A0A0K0DKN3_ANGCA
MCILTSAIFYYLQVKEKALESRWRAVPYKGFIVGSPTTTFNEIVSLAFDDVNNTYNYAKHSRYDEMYHPHLGSFRERKMFTTLAPSLCIPKRNRSCSYELVPHKAYITKQGEWLVERDRKPLQPFLKPNISERSMLRRCYTLPTSTTRFENYFRYWRGRACGLDYIAPFLHPPDYRPSEV